jgi:hypothetical protein
MGGTAVVGDVVVVVEAAVVAEGMTIRRRIVGVLLFVCMLRTRTHMTSSTGCHTFPFMQHPLVVYNCQGVTRTS